MANIKDRPYIGTWSLEGRKLVQHTPDALVYLNGSVTLPGCRSCDGKIDIQKFITEVSVESGVDPNAASASFTMSVPLHSTDSFARDAKFILTPGLEVHIYERGYFPVKGLYSNLAEPLTDASVQSKTPPQEKADKDKHAGHEHDDHDGHDHGVGFKKENPLQEGFAKRKRRGEPDWIVIHESGMNGHRKTENTLMKDGHGVHYIVEDGKTYKYGNDQTDVYSHTAADPSGKGSNSRSIGIEFNHAYTAGKGGAKKGAKTIDAPWFSNSTHKYVVPSVTKLEQLWLTVNKVAGQNNMPVVFGNVQGDQLKFGTGYVEGGSVYTHSQLQGNRTDGEFPVLYMALRQRGLSPQEAYQTAISLADGAKRGATLTLPGDPPKTYNVEDVPFIPRTPEARVNKAGAKNKSVSGADNGFLGPGDWNDSDILRGGLDEEILTQLDDLTVSESLLERFGLQGFGIEDVAAYPYYHTFHGVVIQVSHSWSGGMQTITVQCASMLHFWQYHKINQQAALASGTAVKGSNVAINIEGHNFTGFHPYQIIYKLHEMTMGSQNAVTGSFDFTSNLKAVDPGTNRTLFSLMNEYWNRRFSGRVVNLRMHGISGQMFSTLQSAYLGRTTTDHLTSKIRRYFNRKKDSKKLDAVKGLNLSNDRFMRSFFYSQSPLNAGRGHTRTPGFNSTAQAASGRFGVNVAEIQAFHSALANYANFNLFEATYQSKLDIAQKVMELTGFEFYQDVDGDFVFKPPMWNIDTSSSRVYRIEDIDIINLSFDEKEPQATYCVVKQAMTVAEGLDVGISGDHSKMAVHIDYRLVAKFGYRPFQFETTYLPDPQAMYYMAVARMDVINVPVNSASISIPLRPELRPGYPVYIPYLDCFYYIQSMSHSFSVGGQCTTTLQLVGKRAKFFAPGRTDKTGIDAIDLSDGTLPERPLEVQGNDGIPRLSGFPNVVMALDPNRTNPLEWPTGANLTKMETAKDLRRLLKLASRGGLGLVNDNGDGTYGLSITSGYNDDGTPIAKDVLFYFGDDVKSKPAVKKAVQQAKAKPNGALVEAKEALKQYQGFQKENAATGQTLEQARKKNLEYYAKQTDTLNKELAALKAKSTLTPKQAERVKEIEAEKETIFRQRDRWTAAESPGDQALLEGYQDGVLVIAKFMEGLQDRFFAAQDGETWETLTTASLAMILDNKKATFAPGVKGAYRYYSASHPDPTEQGFGLVTFRTPESGGMELVEENLSLDEEFQDITVQGYVRTPPAQPGTYSAEAKLEEARPVRGILIDTPTRSATVPDKQKALGQVLPTSEILTVAFGTHMTEAPKHATATRKLRKGVGLGTASFRGIAQFLSPKGVGTDPTEESTGEKYYLNEWDELWARVWGGVVLGIRKMRVMDKTADFNHPVPEWNSSFPGSVTIGKKLSLTEPWSSYIKPKGKDKRFKDANALGKAMGEALSKEFQKRLSAGFVALGKAQDALIKEGKLTQELADQYTVAVVDFVASILGVPLGMGSESKQYLVGGKHKTPQWNPVFPVSDALGYEVIGSFQYGRGLNIEPGGVWDAIRSQDPLSVLDTKTVNDLITGLIRGKAITVEVEKTLPGGRVVKEKQELKGKAARGALERNILKTLRKNYSDDQLIDLGLLVKNPKDPNKLDFSMMNWIAGQNEAVHKLPVVNAAFSLADLSFQQEGKICNCRAAEANIKLEAYGAEAFLQFTPSGGDVPTGAGTGETDRATQWLQQENLRASVPHKVQQDTIRGTALEKPSNGLAGIAASFQGPVERLVQTATSAKERVRIFEDQAKAQANRAFSNVEDAFGGGDEEG